MKRLVRWCLGRTSVVIMLAVLVLVAGTFGATQLRQQFFPEINFPFVIAKVEAPGMDAIAADRDVAGPLREAADGVDGAVSTFTVASDNAVRVYTQLEFGTDTEAAKDTFAERAAATELPDGVGQVEFEGDFSDLPTLLVSVAGDDLGELNEQVDGWARDLEEIDGVARVDVSGAPSDEVVVGLRPEALQQGVFPPQVAVVLGEAQAATSAGSILGQGASVPVTVTGPGIEDTAALEALPLGGGAGTVGSVADVRRINGPDQGFVRTNGRPALTMAVIRESDGNEVDIVAEAEDVLSEARDELGDDQVVVVLDTAEEIQKSLRGLLIEATLGAIFAVVVIAFFLRSIRSTLVAAISIPTSLVFGTLAGWMLGLTLNVITLAGLTIAIGRVIDDGIVVLENMQRHIDKGDSRRKAAIEGVSEVGRAIATSTLATAAVFVPIGLVGGFVSEIFLDFSIIVGLALMASLLVAVTVIPVVGSLVLRPAPSGAETAAKLGNIVEPVTRFGVRHPIIVFGTALFVFAGTIFAVGAGAVPTQFFPESGEQQISGTVTLEPGVEAAAAQKALAPFEERLNSDEGIAQWQLGWGSATQDFGDPAAAFASVTFTANLEDSADAEELVNSLREDSAPMFPNGFTVMQVEQGPPSGRFQLTLSAPDEAALQKASARVVALLEERDDTTEISSDAARLQTQLDVRVDPGAAASPENVAATIGAISQPVPAGTLADGTQITVVPPPAGAVPADSLGQIPVVGEGATAATTLGTVAEVTAVERPAIVQRNGDGEFAATVQARLLGDDTAGAIRDIQDDIDDLELGGAEASYENGDAAFIEDMFADLGMAMLVAVVLVYFILVFGFGSLLHPLTILAPVMLSFVGSLLALVITGRALGMPAMIGQLLLIGIVVANSILLVDLALQNRRAGMRRNDALVAAARQRVRPVLMTALATMAALTPLALGISGEGGLISESLGTVVIGGLAVATLLTLVVVPAVATFWDRDRPVAPPVDDDFDIDATDRKPAGTTA